MGVQAFNRFASYGSSFVGFQHRIEQTSRGKDIPVAPQKRTKIAELEGRLQYEALLRQYGGSKGAARTTKNSDYDEIRDEIKSVDLTGSSAVDVKHKSSASTIFDGLHMSLIGQGNELNNEEKLYKINEMVLTEFEFTPFIFQKRFFRKIMQCIAQLIVGEDTWNRRGPAIMKHFKWDTVGSMAVATSFRRGGKTQIVSYVLAAATIVKQLVAGFFGVGKRASEGARNTFLKAIYKSKYADCLPKRGYTTETMSIKTVYDKPGTYSTVSFYPASETIRPPPPSLFLSLFSTSIFLVFHRVYKGRVET